MAQNCIFCNIISGQLAGNICYQDDEIVVLHDIKPQARVHVLIMPKTHISFLNELDLLPVATQHKLLAIIPTIAKQLNIAAGYKVMVNNGKEAGQEVMHLHLHLLGN